jgi:hypothetical protein
MIEKRTLKQIIAEEYARCGVDPVYFMRKYCKIQHPLRGKIDFQLYPFQEKVLKEVDGNRMNIVLKSRQLGISTLTAAYILWKMTFNPDYNVLVVAIKQDVAKNLVTKVRVMYDNLPTWLRIQEEEHNKLSLKLKNGSQVRAVASSPDAGRSDALSLLVLDEAAFIEHINDIWASAQPTLSTGGACIAISCVTADTLLFTDGGIKPIGHLIPSDELGPHHVDSYGVFGNSKVRYGTIFHNNGKVKTKTITTNYTSLTGSLNHKVWAYRNGVYDWFTLDELEPSDWVNIQYGMELWGNHNDLSDFQPHILPNNVNVLTPTQFTPELSYLLGVCLLRGSVKKVYNKYKQYVGGTVVISTANDISYLLRKCKLDFKRDDVGNFVIGSKSLVDLLEYLCISENTDPSTLHIPYRLLTLSRDNVLAIVRAIFDEYSEVTKKIKVTFTNEHLCKQVSAILMNVGIVPLYTNPKGDDAAHTLRLTIHDAQLFSKEIGFGAKSVNFEEIPYHTIYNYVIKYLPNGSQVLSDIIDAYGRSAWVIYKEHGININDNTEPIMEFSYDVTFHNPVRRIYDAIRPSLSPEHVAKYDNILMENGKWVPITEVSYGEDYTYDVSLPDDPSDAQWCHSVVYNGILGHQTPNGVGNWFHKYWMGAEDGSNPFNPIKLHWTVHPERDIAWRESQDVELGTKLAAQECDCSFISSGNTVIDPSILEFYRETFVTPPIEKTGFDGNLWRWEYPVYNKSYIVVADVSRGDGSDNSTAHVIDIDTVTQVAEYRGKLDTKSFGNFLVSLATEYNEAVLVIENSNIGWATIQQVIDRGYRNLFYMSTDLKYVDVENQLSNKLNRQDRNLVAGFSTTSKTRPLIISKLDDYFKDRSVVVKSIRLIEELYTFIYHNGRPEAMRGYHDDLVMAFAIGLWVRDTALKLRQEGVDLTKRALDGIHSQAHPAFYGGSQEFVEDTWTYRHGDQTIDLRDWI